MSVSDGNCGALDAVAPAPTRMLEHGRARGAPRGRRRGDERGAASWRSRSSALLGARRPVPGRGCRARRDRDARGREGARGRASSAEVTGYGTAFVPARARGVARLPLAEAMSTPSRDALADAGIAGGDVDVVVSGRLGRARVRRGGAARGARACARRGHLRRRAQARPRRDARAPAGRWACSRPRRAPCQGSHAPAYAVRGDASHPPRTVLVTALGYYGNASALVMRRRLRARRSRLLQSRAAHEHSRRAIWSTSR